MPPDHENRLTKIEVDSEYIKETLKDVKSTLVNLENKLDDLQQQRTKYMGFIGGISFVFASMYTVFELIVKKL